MKKIIALYLPQYHPTPDNDKWWGKGFTEWTNVAKAKKLYPGHYQPKIPTELGFYDLRMPEIREKQVELAKAAGIYGFCYYHYWFGNGKKELELPFEEVVKSGRPEFPFCLCWANETWHQKFWNKDGAVGGKKVLVEQTYPGQEDDINHFNYLLTAFKDSRYIKIDGKLVFLIYRPLENNRFIEFMNCWKDLAEKNNLPGFFFIAFSFDIEKEYSKLKEAGYDAVFSCSAKRTSVKNLSWIKNMILRYLFSIPARFDFRKLYPHLIGKLEEQDDVFPLLIPNWDHTPRSGRNGYLFTHTDPEIFKKHVKYVFEKIRNKPQDRQICFLKSWNEWGEGNYMEPDIKYGRGYIEALSEAIKSDEKGSR